MPNPVRSSLRTLSVAAGVGLLALSRTAMATVITLNPAASSPALTTSGSSQFQADSATVSSYISANIKANGSFTESGILPITAFGLSGTQVLPPGYLGQPGATPSYSLYLKFQASGTGVSGGNGAGSQSSFNTLNYFLYGDLGNDDGTLAVQAQPTGVAFSGSTSNDVILGIGSLISGSSTLTANTASTGPALIPAQTLLTTFTPTSTTNGFYTGPSKLALSLTPLSGALGTVTETQGANNSLNLLVSGGSGSLLFGGTSSPPPSTTPVSEPSSFLLIGAGMLAALIARRKFTL
jgi:hypothetical protein